MPRYKLTVEDTITIARTATVEVDADSEEAAREMAEKMTGRGTYPQTVVSGQTPGGYIEYGETEIDNTPWEITVELCHGPRITAEYIPHNKALDFIGPTKGDPDLAGWYWSSSSEPELDPQGPFPTEEEALRDGREKAIEE